MSEGIETEQGQKGLQSLSLEVSYNSGEHELLNEFYIPCLKHADRYDRAAGYFDSKSLTIAAQGVSELVVNEGKMQLIASPRLSPDDIEVLEKIAQGEADEDQESEIVEGALHRGLSAEQFSDFLKQDRFKCMAWMLQEDLLEIKIAYLRDADETNPFSHYHEKIGVFTDKYGNKAAFSGSINETELGWTDNYESFNVYPNWTPGLDMLASEKQSHFKKLWNNEDPRVIVKELPDAVEEGLKEHSPDTVDGRPDLEMFEDDSGGQREVETDSDDGISLWPHQKEAVDTWIANDYTGIMAMATGTGKTRAAIKATNLDANNRLTIIAVPKDALLSQWKSSIEDLIPDADVMICSSDTSWDDRIISVVNPYKIASPDLIQGQPKQFIVTTVHTAIGDAFKAFVQDIPPQHLQLVADEVHRYGADSFSQLFDYDAGRRLGLSATPERRDEKGNERIEEYFEDIIFEYRTKEAVREGYLTDYEYHPLICELNEEEYENYKEYSKWIAQVIEQLEDASPSERSELEEKKDDWQRKRAKILKKAESKPDRFEEFLKSDHPTPAIIFCEDTEQLDDIRERLNNQNKQFAEYVSDMDSEKKSSAFYQFNKGHVDYLLAIECLDEGVDVPDCPTGVVISSTSNERQFIQRRGRVLRKSEEKDKAVVYDMITLPGLSANEQDDTARNFIEKELDRARVFMEAAENRDSIRLQLNEELEPYGFGHLAFIST
jgi:superfamily II DNA or RNA helicase